ncbi:hypothetical protein STEG23_006380 [Scotinomys teguina]
MNYSSWVYNQRRTESRNKGNSITQLECCRSLGLLLSYYGERRDLIQLKPWNGMASVRCQTAVGRPVKYLAIGILQKA